jgi:hypothetical protein
LFCRNKDYYCRETTGATGPDAADRKKSARCFLLIMDVCASIILLNGVLFEKSSIQGRSLFEENIKPKRFLHQKGFYTNVT